MSEVEEQGGLVPELRFGEFAGAWKVDKFSAFIKLYRGSSPRPISKFITEDQDGVNWIKIGDTKHAKNFVLSKVSEKITHNGAKKSRSVIKGELILANSMSYGATYKLDIEGCIYDGWFVLREYEINFNKEYLLQLLNSSYMQQQYTRLAAGGIVQNISSEIVYNTLLPRPRRKEQKKIAKTLSSLDALITAHTDKLTALREHKKGLLQQLFPGAGKFVPGLRFEGFVGEWEEAKLGDKHISSFVNKKAKHLDINNYVSTVNLLQNFKGVKKAESLPQSGSFTEFKPGDILMSNIRPNLKKVWVALNSGTSSNDVLVFRTGKRCSEAYLSHIIKSDRFINYVMKGAKGVKMPRGDKNQIKAYPMTIPGAKEQQKIADCLTTLDDSIAAQSKKIKNLRAHKKGLMQRLFPNPNG